MIPINNQRILIGLNGQALVVELLVELTHPVQGKDFVLI